MIDLVMTKSLASELRAILGAVTDDVVLRLTGSGLAVDATDPAHVAMVSLRAEKGAFEAFTADEMDVGMDLDKFSEILRVAKAEDTVRLSLDGSNVWTAKASNITRRFPISDPGGVPKVPQFPFFKATADLLAEPLKPFLVLASTISADLAIKVSQDRLEMATEDSVDSVSLAWTKEQLQGLHCTEPCASSFPLDYVMGFAKAIPSGTVLRTSVGNDYPCKLEFTLAGGKVQGTYILAPRTGGG